MSGSVFISYSTSDKYFAELLEGKLNEAKVDVWRDRTSLSAGELWRDSIDIGIADSNLVIVALSAASCNSHYVTYEWAVGIAKAKPILPILLENCEKHPKLGPLQHIDFRNHEPSSWQMVISRVQEMLAYSDTPVQKTQKIFSAKNVLAKFERQELTKKIIAYMNLKGFRMISFDRVKETFSPTLTTEEFENLVADEPRFRNATLSKERVGLLII